MVPVPVREHALRAWLERRLGALDDVAEVEVGERTPLTGGVASATVQKVEVATRHRDGRQEAHPVVAKRASDVEALALGLLAEIPDVTTFPELVDAGARAYVNATYAGAVAERYDVQGALAMLRTARQAYSELRTLLAAA